MAPAHSFDRNTVKVLKELKFKYITDGIALFPFRKYDLSWFPQQLWSAQKKLFGVWTVCIHPNSINDDYITHLEAFIHANLSHCLFDIKNLPHRNAWLLNPFFKILWNSKNKLYKLFKK